MLNQWVILLSLIPISYFIGLTIVNTVDKRMSDISINMPKIVLPPQKITVTIDRLGTSGNNNTTVKSTYDTVYQDQNQNQNGSTTSILESFSSNDDITCRRDDDCNIVNGDGANKCQDGKCQCVTGSGHLCHEGNTYYLDPKDMTAQQVSRFKKNANFTKMTAHDYRNWLELYRDDPSNLPDRHHEAFRKLIRGEKIISKDVPFDLTPRPNTGEEYYKKLVGSSGEQMKSHLETINLETGGWQQGYNSDEYTEFVTPTDLKHLHVIPPVQRDTDDQTLKMVRPIVTGHYSVHHKSL